jgi:WD40 repeat protein
MSRVFISYAHRDGREAAMRMSELLAAEGHEPWLDRERLLVGAGWSEGIERAIDSSDVVLALLSHAAYQSDICRAEQLRALRRGKRVLPILLQPDADRPIHLESRQFADLSGSPHYREVLELLELGEGAVLPARYRKERVTRPSFSFTPMARPREIDCLRRALIREQPDQRICLTALRGMAGVGKTVLSALVFEEPAVRDAFPDGRIWLTIGQNPTDADLLAQLREVPRTLGESLENYESLTSAANELRTTLKDKAVFIVLDDVWDVHPVRYFLADAPRCCVLMTTRDDAIARGARATSLSLDTLDDVQARALLADRAGLSVDALPPVAQELIGECGNLPLALAMVGAQLQGGREEDWDDALLRLQRAKLDRVGASLPDYDRYPDLYSAIHVSVERLPARDRAHYPDWAAFPTDTPIPPETFAALWQEDAADARETLRRWCDASLAVRDDSGRVTVHDLQHDYARATNPDVAAAHRRLVRGYRDRAGGRLAAVPFDSYVERHLVRHLVQASETATLDELLLQPEWIRRKVTALPPPELLADFESVRDSSPHRLIEEALHLCSHILFRDSRQLTAQLVGRLRGQDDPVVRQFVAALLAEAQCPWFEPLEPTLTGPGSELVRTITDEKISALTVSPDERIAYSGGTSGRICAWDLETGSELFALECGAAPISGLALFDHGRRLAAGDEEGRLRYWNLAMKECEREIQAHRRAIEALAITPDGRVAVTGALDPTPKVWDTSSGELVVTLTGHSDNVRDLWISPAGDRVLTNSQDGTTRLWTLPDGALIRTCSPAGESRGFASDGGVVVNRAGGVDVCEPDSGAIKRSFPNMPFINCADRHHLVSLRPLTVWDSVTGSAVGSVSNSQASLEIFAWDDVAYLPQRQEVLTAHPTLRQWRLSRERGSPPADDHLIACVAVADGLAVSAGHGGGISIWDLASREVTASFNMQGRPDKVALSEDASRLLIATGRGRIEVWDRESQVRISTIDELASRMAITSDGKHVVVGTSAGIFKRYRLHDGSEVNFEAIVYPSRITAAAISSEAGWSLTGLDRGAISYWDLETNEIVAVLEGHEGRVNWLEFSPDSRWAFSAAADLTIRVWDLAEERLHKTVQLGWPLLKFALHSDLRHVLGVDSRGALVLIDLHAADPIRAALDFDAWIKTFAYCPRLRIAMLADAAGVVHFIQLRL